MVVNAAVDDTALLTVKLAMASSPQSVATRATRTNADGGASLRSRTSAKERENALVSLRQQPPHAATPPELAPAGEGGAADRGRLAVPCQSSLQVKGRTVAAGCPCERMELLAVGFGTPCSRVRELSWSLEPERPIGAPATAPWIGQVNAAL